MIELLHLTRGTAIRAPVRIILCGRRCPFDIGQIICHHRTDPIIFAGRAALCPFHPSGLEPFKPGREFVQILDLGNGPWDLVQKPKACADLPILACPSRLIGQTYGVFMLRAQFI